MVKYQEECQEGREHCYKRRDSREHSGGRGKNNGEQRSNGAHTEGEYGVCWEKVGGREIEGT